jgi:hypothetical protein
VLAKVTLVKIANYCTSVCDKFGGDVAAYIGMSVMSNSVSNTVIRGFSKTKSIVSKLAGLNPCWCVYGSLFGSRMSQVMRSWLCDVSNQLV